ncbi:DUF6383 domain-containing protein [Parabacteroides sp. GYB001]|uniref:DUF6383 domain-containing protein n=1 Tax=Parabacteroides leei TaxID=2939491 RepID=UPI0020182492|nr:DUF6383 domain-containing protein [Parabacteroides leei]MCL3853585.1 DUF6383 domain-containing protein [Parabacteroides leei]
MNKKFSTLLAGAALLIGAVSVNAQGDNYATLFGKLQKSSAVEKLKADDKGLYQLSNQNGSSSNADSVLYMAADGKLKMVPAPQSADSLANTLWCVTITASSNQGQSYAYDFFNKGTGQRLDITMQGLEGLAKNTLNTDTVTVGGEIAGWAFAPAYEKELTQDNYLYSYFSKDSVVGLAMGTAKGNPEGVFAVKTGAAEAMRQDASTNLTKFTLKKAAEIVLNAKQINTLFGQQDADKGVALTFKPDVNKVSQKNPFANKDAKFIAEQVSTSAGDSVNYVYVLKSDSSYLKVDTALANTTGTKFLAYGWSKLDVKSRKGHATAQDSLKNSALKAQSQFLFTYKPSVDSVSIYVHSAIFQTPTGKSWSNPSDINVYANAHVSIQDLVKADEIRILTVDSLAQNTHISLNYSGCGAVVTDNISVDNGLYIIKNKKGQVLAAPIHRNGTNRDAVEWVTLDTQEPTHMPAYQWVVAKTQSAAALKETSPIRFINREYGLALTDTLQLKKNDEGKTVASGVLFNGLSMDEFTLTQITDSTIIKDTVLGYKYVKPVDLDITKYKFNYLHPYSQEKYIGLSKDSKDSALYVKDDMGAFNLKEGNYATYGIDPATVKDYVPGLAQLHRMQYVIVMNNDTLVGNAKDQYTMGNVGTAAIDSFYFKANNFFGGKDYYAIVQAKRGDNKIDDNAKKAGVADDGMSAILKVQKLEETRTSAFTVEPLDAPLYRRFDSEALEGNAGDAADTLRFVEAYRGEVLQIEGNPTFKVPGIDMLGIYTTDKAPSGLSFIVDTAWVNRGLGYIKPQYLISIERNDQPGKVGEPCKEAGPHVDINGNLTDDATQCVHGTLGTPGFQRGKYLVNFADSAAANVDAPQNVYKWKGYDRVGFVEAIRVVDTLYILRDEFKNLPNDKINIAAIKKADSIAVSKKGISYIHRLDNDKHKFVTWSMRFMNPEVAANEVETDRSFLVESMKNVNDLDIAPVRASWLKNQNGCLVMSNYDSNFNELQTGGDDALVFNVKHVANDEIATDNDVITTSTVSVVAGNGEVTIKGAQGKTVTLSNVLGQTIANTVLSSDDATIAAPAGVVVVAIEGEAAVKAIVK